MPSNEEVVQIVISELIDKSKKERFIELTKQMKKWFINQDGFVPYEAYENNEKLADKIVYKNNDSAKRINKLFMDTSVAKEMLSLVKSNYTGFMGKSIEL